MLCSCSCSLPPEAGLTRFTRDLLTQISVESGCSTLLHATLLHADINCICDPFFLCLAQSTIRQGRDITHVDYYLGCECCLHQLCMRELSTIFRRLTQQISSGCFSKRQNMHCLTCLTSWTVMIGCCDCARPFLESSGC